MLLTLMKTFICLHLNAAAGHKTLYYRHLTWPSRNPGFGKLFIILHRILNSGGQQKNPRRNGGL